MAPPFPFVAPLLETVEAATVTWPSADIAPPFSLAALPETVETTTPTLASVEIAPPLPV